MGFQPNLFVWENYFIHAFSTDSNKGGFFRTSWGKFILNNENMLRFLLVIQ